MNYELWNGTDSESLCIIHNSHFIIQITMATIEVRKKEGESAGSMLFRFSKKIRQSGVLTEARKRQFKHRAVNRRKRRLSAAYREKTKSERTRLKKLGLVS